MNTHPQIKSCHHELKEGILTLPSYSNKRHPFLFASHCFPVQAFTCKACSSSHNPFSFIKLLISRCLFNNGMPSNVSLTMVSSSLAPQPSEWSRMVHSICEGYCFFTWFCGMYKILWSWSDWLDDASHMMSRVLMSNGTVSLEIHLQSVQFSSSHLFYNSIGEACCAHCWWRYRGRWSSGNKQRTIVFCLRSIIACGLWTTIRRQPPPAPGHQDFIDLPVRLYIHPVNTL